MIKLYDSNITDILPEALSGRANVAALGYAVNRAMQRLIEYCRGTSVYAVIDSVPDNVLDMLALELNTQYYSDSFDITTKRRLIKNTLIWHMTSGTPAAVEELVAAVFGKGEVKEWFEYGDDPYYFKITTNATMTPDMNEQFTAMLEKVKNTRSHIRAIEIHRIVNQTIYAGVSVGAYYKPAPIIDGYEVGRRIDQFNHAAIAVFSEYKPAAIINGNT